MLSLATKWRKSVVFRLSAVMAIVAAFVTVTQISVAMQVLRLNATQKSVLEHSVPLLEHSQEFAQLMTTTLSQTAKVQNDLSIEALRNLWPQYIEQKIQLGDMWASIDQYFPAEDGTESFRSSQTELIDTIDQQFENQILQRELEERLYSQTLDILRLTTRLEDITDQILTTSTTTILTAADEPDSDVTIGENFLGNALNFAKKTETLHTLNSHFVDISSVAQGVSKFEWSVEDLSIENRLRFRIRGITQAVAQLSDVNERKELAQLVSKLNHLIFSEDGYLSVAKKLIKSQEEFEELKRRQVDFVSIVDREVSQIVSSAASKFRDDIHFADSLAQIILWIGIITTLLVTFGLIWVNKKLIKEQISDRFVTVTQDVLAISDGNYDHLVRVTGQDELADIANALDVFKKQAAELKRSNAELERFAYVAAHDLKSPLDAIQDLAKWTLEDSGDELSDDCRKNLELLIKRSARLSALQTDLLTYAQASSGDEAIITLHLRSEISAIADMLDPNGRYQIELLDNPGDFTCHGTAVRQILINLVTNAIKHHDQNHGKIKVAISRHEGMLKFTVQDDGPGIEPRFQNQIFELFKTLKTRDHVEGSGLGLALILKLVERFGGSVSVKSDAPATRGTTFVFELPDLDAHNQISNAA